MPASWDNYPPNYRPATKADIFAAFEAGTHMDDYIEAPEHPFGPEMSLHHWAVATDDDFNRWDAFGHLRKWLMETYQVQIDLREWRAFVRKPKQITLSDVCRFTVQRGGWMLDPKPLRVAGRECEEAGIFLTLRSAMSQAVDGNLDYAPSTPIDRFARNNLEYFYSLLYLTCPRLAGKLQIKCSLATLVLGCTLLILLPMGVLRFFMSYTGIAFFTMSWYMWLCIFIPLIIALVLFSGLPPRRIEIKGLETMADLSREIVRGRRQSSTE